MSQAEKPNTTNRLSRRSALAGLAGAAAAGATALPAAALGVDPIFAVIDQHREAWSTYKEREEKFEVFRKKEIEDGPVHTGIVVGQYRRQPIIAGDWGEIAANIPLGLSEIEGAAWMDEKKAELARFREEEHEASGLTPRGMAYDAWNESWNVVDRVTMQLLTTQPTTIAGVISLLQCWGDFAVEDQEVEEFVWGDRPIELVENVVEALRAIV
jgi:hypothetical protein